MEIKEGFVICDNNIKTDILKNNKLKNYTFLDFNNLIFRLYGKASKRAIFYVSNKYNMSYELSKNILNYLPYIDINLNYNDFKLDSLKTIKKDLIDNNLYDNDLFFNNLIKNKNVTFINPLNIGIYDKAVKDLSEISSVEIIENKKEYKYLPKVFALSDATEEALYVCQRIIDLRKKNVDFNNIHILNITNKHEFIFKRLKEEFKLPISFSVSNIGYQKICKDFIKYCDEYNSFKEILDKLDKKSKFYLDILNIISNYELEDETPSLYKDFFIEEFKHVKYESLSYEKQIGTNFKEFSDDDYVFYLGFNLGISPRSYKDTQYLNDIQLKQIGLLTSYQKNNQEKEEIEKLFKTTKNLVITYAKNDTKEKLEPSYLLSQMNLESIDVDLEFGYSKTSDDLRLGISYSNYIKYKNVDHLLNEYDINHLNYNSYDNTFKGVNKELIENKFKENKLMLSYSSIKTLYECPFKYYCARILSLDEFEKNMAARIGSFSHELLEESYLENFDFNESFIRLKDKYKEDAKTDFFMDQMKIVLGDLINYNKDHEQISDLDSVLLEPKVLDEHDNYIFEGFIDKLLYKQVDDKIYAAIIDYKTGKDIVSLDNVEDGFHLQLPSYIYLLSKYEPFKGKEVNIIGIFLQKVNIILLDNTKDILKQRLDSFKLEGYSIDQTNLLSMLDKTYMNSSYIKSMRVKNDGDFYNYSKVISKDKIDYLASCVDKLVIKASEDILNGNFKIAPKEIDGFNQSCTFCKFKDMCYMKFKDIVKLERKVF